MKIKMKILKEDQMKILKKNQTKSLMKNQVKKIIQMIRLKKVLTVIVHQALIASKNTDLRVRSTM